MIVEARTIAAAPLAVVAPRTLRHLRAHEFDPAASAALATDAPTLVRAGVAGLTKQVAVQALDPVYGPQRVLIAIRWVATGISGDLFPALDANLELRATGADTTEVVLVGSYQPPFGRAGVVLDQLVMHRMAERSLRSFLDQLVEIVTTPQPAKTPPRPAASAVLRLETDS